MAWEKRVAWTEGMMLQPQHFQQQTRYHEAQLRRSIAVLHSHYWGFDELEIDEQMLKTGRFQINKASGMFNDGSAFFVPTIENQPVALELSIAHLNATIFLAVPFQRTAEQDFYRDEKHKGRHTLSELELSDVCNLQNDAAYVEVTGLNVSLRTSLQDNSEYNCLAIAEVEDVSPNGAVTLKKDVIPTLLNAKTSAYLEKFVSEVITLIEHRIDSLATRVSVVGKSAGSEVVDYMLLQTLNRHKPVFKNLEQERQVTPFYLYEKLINLVADMSTLVEANHKVPPIPVYRHNNLTEVFIPVMNVIRQQLSVVLEQNSILIELQEKKFGIRVGTISDRSLLSSASFILAVGADASIDEIRQHFPSQVKIGSVDVIKELVNLQLPGIQVSHLAAAPREIPYQRQFAYFELVAKGEYWEGLKSSGGIAIHLSNQLPNLQIELWAIRN